MVMYEDVRMLDGFQQEWFKAWINKKLSEYPEEHIEIIEAEGVDLEVEDDN